MSNQLNNDLQLTNLDDFITPSQLCIKSKVIKGKKGKEITNGLVSLRGSKSKSRVNKQLEKSLNDCLSCSGCVTSAETKSHEKLYKVIDNNFNNFNNKKILVVSVSPQARASLAVSHSITAEDASLAMSLFFKSLGVSHVYETSFAKDIALIQSALEFMNRYKDDKNGSLLPMLTSSCPGWICYAEKTHGELLIPFISTVKSPQQITGSLIKQWVSCHHNISQSDVYHVCIMPCYDKKLEASRDDFYNDLYATKDVDLVLTSEEVQKMLEEKEITLKSVLQNHLEQSPDNVVKELAHAYLDVKNDVKYSHAGGGSGGYLEHVFKYAAQNLFGIKVENVQYTFVRNSKDFREVVLKDSSDEKVLLRFAAAYGFKSIQNLVQKIKHNKCNYHFIEVMACPSGCLNGDGQIKPKNSDKKMQKVHLDKTEKVYEEIPTVIPGFRQETQKLLKLLHENNEKFLKDFIYTSYHAIKRDEPSLDVKW